MQQAAALPPYKARPLERLLSFARLVAQLADSLSTQESTPFAAMSPHSLSLLQLAVANATQMASCGTAVRPSQVENLGCPVQTSPPGTVPGCDEPALPAFPCAESPPPLPSPPFA